MRKCKMKNIEMKTASRGEAKEDSRGGRGRGVHNPNLRTKRLSWGTDTLNIARTSLPRYVGEAAGGLIAFVRDTGGPTIVGSTAIATLVHLLSRLAENVSFPDYQFPF